MTVMIDTLGARNRLIKEYGIEKKTAEGIVSIFSELDDHVATKADLQLLQRDLKLFVLGSQIPTVAILGSLMGFLKIFS